MSDILGRQTQPSMIPINRTTALYDYQGLYFFISIIYIINTYYDIQPAICMIILCSTAKLFKKLVPCT